jgi:hypothetical protein
MWVAWYCFKQTCPTNFECCAQLAKGGSAGLVSWVQTVVLPDTPAAGAGGRLAARRLQASDSRKQDAGRKGSCQPTYCPHTALAIVESGQPGASKKISLCNQWMCACVAVLQATFDRPLAEQKATGAASAGLGRNMPGSRDVFTMPSCAARAPKTVVCLQAAQTGELVEDSTDIMHHGRRLQV